MPKIVTPTREVEVKEGSPFLDTVMEIIKEEKSLRHGALVYYQGKLIDTPEESPSAIESDVVLRPFDR